jgi:hypothetical protein
MTILMHSNSTHYRPKDMLHHTHVNSTLVSSSHTRANLMTKKLDYLIFTMTYHSWYEYKSTIPSQHQWNTGWTSKPPLNTYNTSSFECTPDWGYRETCSASLSTSHQQHLLVLPRHTPCVAVPCSLKCNSWNVPRAYETDTQFAILQIPSGLHAPKHERNNKHVSNNQIQP